jgi:hypothetical protein
VSTCFFEEDGSYLGIDVVKCSFCQTTHSEKDVRANPGAFSRCADRNNPMKPDGHIIIRRFSQGRCEDDCLACGYTKVPQARVMDSCPLRVFAKHVPSIKFIPPPPASSTAAPVAAVKGPGSIFDFDAWFQTSRRQEKADRKRCVQCTRELCAELDAYYGKDDWEALKCSDCRLGRSYSRRMLDK